MGSSGGHKSADVVSTSALLITLGIIFGDIGTSPLYVMKAIVGSRPISEELILGSLSCIFWTLTLQTTVKYVWLTLQADNNGEGGIFSLYTLIRARSAKYAYVALAGGSMLLADGIITPPITVSAAIEGLAVPFPDLPSVPIVIVILLLIFITQQQGTSLLGKFFGPIMLLWFLMLGGLGLINLWGNWSIVLEAINPINAWNLLMEYPEGFGLLGFVFLCTTGAEALYSDLGHCGRSNIRITWTGVKVCLLLNYFGQASWLLTYKKDGLLGTLNPFFGMMPEWFLPYGIAMATMAAIIASQALISGSYTLVSEGTRLNFWPKIEVIYPTNIRGQIYIPSVNWLLCFGCIGVVLYFKKSEHMEAAYGLAITVTMLMTTVLLVAYGKTKKWNKILIGLIAIVFGCIEVAFLVSNLAKFMHGGYVSLVLAGVIFSVMFIWTRAHLIKKLNTEMEAIEEYLPLINQLSDDKNIPKRTENLVYLTSSDNVNMIEKRILESIFDHHPKRADIYWFVHVDTDNEPYKMEYTIHKFDNSKNVLRVTFNLGFKVDIRIDMYMRQIIAEMIKNKEIETVHAAAKYDFMRDAHTGDIQYIVMKRSISHDNELTKFQDALLSWFYRIKKLTITEDEWFGIDKNNLVIEEAVLMLKDETNRNIKLVRRESAR
ncbi:MAG: potassium transporter Kup [Cytophagales bacterium]|nr:MAG: potassium transporter Kup [Cytophagales bacterium]TAF61955.1 MAG: potassium transporter Kup [Cytophagales bacterium]